MTPDPAALARTHRAANRLDRAWSASEFAGLLAAAGTILAGDAESFVLGRVTLDEAEVLTLATAPAVQRQGRARAALAAFARAAQARGAVRLFLEVAQDNAAARALYGAAGFREIGRRPRYFVRPDGAVGGIVMARDL